MGWVLEGWGGGAVKLYTLLTADWLIENNRRLYWNNVRWQLFAWFNLSPRSEELAGNEPYMLGSVKLSVAETVVAFTHTTEPCIGNTRLIKVYQSWAELYRLVGASTAERLLLSSVTFHRVWVKKKPELFLWAEKLWELCNCFIFIAICSQKFNIKIPFLKNVNVLCAF